MTPDLYWIQGPWAGRLAIASRPRGGDWLEDELRAFRSAGVDARVSLLQKEEEAQLNLSDECALAEANGIKFRSLPIPDRGVPSSAAATHALLLEMTRDLDAGKNVAVHCRQGLGRSPLIAIGALAAGLGADAAILRVSSGRGLEVPETSEQRRWLETVLADQLLVATERT